MINTISDRTTLSDPASVLSVTPRRASKLTALVSGLVGALAFGALLSSSYLAYVGLTSSKVVGCDGGVFDCSHVLTSRWSEVLGVPVGVPAVLVYLLMLVALALTHSAGETLQVWALRSVWVLSMTAALSAVWFISLQVTSIGRLCPYCLLVHGCGIVLAALMVWKVPLGRIMAWKLTSLSALLVTTMIVIQWATPVPETFVIEEAAPTSVGAGDTEVFEAPVFEAPTDEDATSSSTHTQPLSLVVARIASFAAWQSPAMLTGVLMAPQEPVPAAKKTTPARKLVPILGGSKSLDASQWPLWGNPAADHVVVEMFDYTCSHCRNTHKAIREASEKLQGNFAVIALPVPLHRDCNDAATSASPERAHACEIARLAVAVWLTDRKQFTKFHDWLFQQERTAAGARAFAEQLIGGDALRQQLAKPTAAAYLSRNVELYKQAGSGTVPKIILPTKTLVGEVSSGATIADMLRQ